MQEAGVSYLLKGPTMNNFTNNFRSFPATRTRERIQSGVGLDGDFGAEVSEFGAGHYFNPSVRTDIFRISATTARTVQRRYESLSMPGHSNRGLQWITGAQIACRAGVARIDRYAVRKSCTRCTFPTPGSGIARCLNFANQFISTAAPPAIWRYVRSVASRRVYVRSRRESGFMPRF